MLCPLLSDFQSPSKNFSRRKNHFHTRRNVRRNPNAYPNRHEKFRQCPPPSKTADKNCSTFFLRQQRGKIIRLIFKITPPIFSVAQRTKIFVLDEVIRPLEFGFALAVGKIFVNNFLQVLVRKISAQANLS